MHRIRNCTPEDAERICEIYNHYVRETVVTFEETPVDAPEMARRIADVTVGFPWIVAETADGIAGYAYASAWKPRAAYRHSVECSIYLSPRSIGRGLGSALYRALIEELSKRGVHCVIGGAALPNDASVALHEKLGFTKVAQFREVGFKFGRRVDVAYWQLILRAP